MQWYEDQKVSSTKFQSVQHRRGCEPPFFHEFILLQLDDGSICRIDRAGEGSRIAAVRNTGCTANDYIRWFPTRDYKDFFRHQPSDLIAEVDFRRKFDIMDVLAICWSIHREPRTRVYTLQRFNCYFHCGAILSILARRLTRWEPIFTPTVWADTLHQVHDQLIHVSCDQETSDFVLHVCHVLEPDCADPAGFISGALRAKLGTADDIYRSLSRALAATLWQTNWTSGCLIRALAGHVNAASAVAIEDNGRGTKAYRLAISDQRQFLQEKIESFATVNGIVAKKAVGALSNGATSLVQSSSEGYQMEKIECPSYTVSKLAAQLNREMADLSLHETLAELEVKDMLTVPNMTSAPHTILMENLWDAWLNRSVLDVLVANLPDMLKPEELEEGRILVRIPDPVSSLCEAVAAVLTGPRFEEKEGLYELKTVARFQDHMLQHIEAHATRVEEYRLAAAPLVAQDVQNAMTEVWKSLPVDFGSSGLEE